MPSPAVGFRVTTPTSVIVDLGTIFDVAVESDGTTLVEVRQGHISAVPVDEPELQQWQLMADDMNEVTFYPRLVSAEKGPVASAARGFGGQFSGVISLNDSTLKFTSEQEFERIRQELQTLFQTSPNRRLIFGNDWLERNCKVRQHRVSPPALSDLIRTTSRPSVPWAFPPALG